MACSSWAQDGSIKTDTRQSLGEASPYLYGQFIEYCCAIGCEPMLVVNIATGTPDEAAESVQILRVKL